MCINKLEIIGDINILELIKNNFKLSWFKPCTKDIKENWGTKAEIIDINIIIKDNTLFADFRSKENPPIGAINGLAEKYPELDITLNYINYKDEVYGEVAWEDGESVFDVTYGMEEALNNMSIMDLGDL